MYKRTRSWSNYNVNKKLKNDDSEYELSSDDLSDSISTLSVSDEFEYQKILDNIEDKKVTVSKIMNSQLLDCEKEDAIEVVQMIEEDQLTPMHAMQANKALSHFIDGVTPFDNVRCPTLSDILKANLTPYNRILAIQTYQTFYQLSINTEQLYTEEWFSLRKKLLNLLNTNFDLPKQLDNIKDQIDKLKTTQSNKNKIYQMVNEGDKDKNKTKVKLYLQLTYDKVINVNVSCETLYHKLNEHIYKMDKIKEKLTITYYHRQLNPTTVSIIALKGVPGTAKTRIVKLLADALGLPFSKISFGGAHGATLLKGSEQVWI